MSEPVRTLPTYVRTKSEALELAKELFPDHRIAQAKVKHERPTDEYPFYWIEQRVQDDLKAIFNWLFDDKTRIYKRARWHLFYDMSVRIPKLLRENYDAIDRHWRNKHADEEREKRLRSQVVAGDGDGI